MPGDNGTSETSNQHLHCLYLPPRTYISQLVCKPRKVYVFCVPFLLNVASLETARRIPACRSGPVCIQLMTGQNHIAGAMQLLYCTSRGVFAD